jgi:hypothetical protein
MKFNDQAWRKIFNELKILITLRSSTYFSISARQIKDIGLREPRLMAKFDTKESLPQIFRQNNLNIIAISNGNYIIFKDPHYRSFIELPDYSKTKLNTITPDFVFDLETLVFSTRMSESNAIDFAHHSKIISAYAGENEIKLTSRGRFFSDSFLLQLDNIGNINVKGVQIEVDSAYEGLNQFLIIEAKSGTRKSFNIRQLYYPFKHFQNNTNKQIRTILLSFSNGIYYFTEIELTDKYFDYKILRNEAYEVIIGEPVEIISIPDLISQETYKPIGIPVPQADDLNKAIDLLSFLFNNPSDKYEIAEHFEFDERQGDYYGNASGYIGLTSKQGTKFILTPNGLEISQLKNRKKRNLEVIRAILRTKLFNDLVKLYLKNNKILDDSQIIYRIAQEGLTGTTPERRKSTIKSWLSWIDDNLKE